MENTFSMVAKTFKGLEPVLRDELLSLGAENVEMGTRMVSFEGDLEKMLGSTAYVPTTFVFDSEGNQVGEAVIGAPGDPEKDYLKGINDALAASGKDAVQLK